MRLSHVFVVITLFTLFSTARASEWYENVQFVDSDPFQFDSQRSVLFPHSGLTLSGHPAAGTLFAILPTPTVTRLQNDPKHLIILDSHTLSAQEAASYKTIFHSASNAGQVPWIVGAIGSIPSAVTTAVGITSTLLDGLMRYEQASNKVSAAALAELMSTNGRFDLALLLLRDPDTPSHQFVSSTVVYTVTVGGENR